MSDRLELAIELTAYAMSLLSMWLYARKSIWGPIVGILDIVPWTVVALKSGVPSLVAYNFVYVVINAYAIWNWRKKPDYP